MNPNAVNETSMLRDVLTSHNRMTEQCFESCITKLRQNKLTDEEKLCVDKCTERFMTFNQRLMAIFFEQQQHRIQAATSALEQQQQQQQQNNSTTPEAKTEDVAKT